MRILFSQSHRYLHELGQPVASPTLTESRRSPIGAVLAHLGQVAEGSEQANQEDVFRAVNSVLEMLFLPAGEDQYQVPRSFWEEPLGKMLSQAKWRSVDHAELMSIGAAAERLGVARPSIYRWMEDHTLNYVHDQMSGRAFVLRHDVDQLREEALQAQDEPHRIAHIND